MAIDAAPIDGPAQTAELRIASRGWRGATQRAFLRPLHPPGSEWVDAQESSSATGIQHVACRAGVRPITSHPILQRSQTPTGGELRGDHQRQRDNQKASIYCFWHSSILFGASFIWLSPTDRCPGGRIQFDAQILPADRKCNHRNDTLRFCGFVPHWRHALWLRARLHGGCISVCLGLLPATLSPMRRRLGFHGSASRDVAHQHEVVLCDGS